ncbi:MAG: STAS domain-containing protein [Cyanobacteria bacterium P01_E01_bin.42]
MMKGSPIPRIPLQLSQEYIVASIQIDLTEEVLKQFRQDLLDRLYQTHAKGLILDLSGVEVMDYADFQAIDATLSMASVMGATTILTGFQPGVVSSLVDFNAELDHIQATLNLDDAFELMRRLHSDVNALFAEESEEDLETELEEDEASRSDIVPPLEENLEDNGSI